MFLRTEMVGDFNADRRSLEASLGECATCSLMLKANGEFSHIDTSRQLTDYNHIVYSGALKVVSRPSLSVKARKYFDVLDQPTGP